MIKKIKAYLFGSGELVISQKEAYFIIKINNSEIVVHNDAVDDLIEHLNKSRSV